MIAQFVVFLQEHILPLGAGGVFLASVAEEIVSPVPSPLVQMAAGFLFLPATFSIDFVLTLVFTIILPISFGVVVGSLLLYFIAFYAGKPVLVRWGKWLGVSWASVEKVQRKFDKSRLDEILILIFRTIPVMPSSAVSFFCGLVRVNLWTYLWTTFVGTLFRSTILALVGWQAGVLYYKYAEFIDRFEGRVISILIFVVVVYLVVWNFRRIKKQKTNV